MNAQELQLDLYKRMLLIRLVEEKIAEVYKEQEMRCPTHLCVGQEAISAGVCAALEKSDIVMSTHRSHGHFLGKGGNLKKMMAEIYGRADGCCNGKGGSMHLVDLEVGFMGAVPIVGSTTPIAVGTAFGSWLRGEDTVSATFFGEASTEEGVFHESIQFAVLKQLPIVFVCENNGFSVNTPLEDRRPDGFRIAEMVKGHGMESHIAEGNDVQTVYELSRMAVDKARAGNGPTLLEFDTYRWREHCGPNDDHHLECRSLEDFEQWKTCCPVASHRQHLLAASIMDESALKQFESDMENEVEEAFAFAKQSPQPDPATASGPIYAS